MRILRNILTAILLCFFLFTAPSTPHIIPLKLRTDNRSMIPFSHFEFSNVGYVSVVISSVTVTSNSTSTSSQPDPSRIGFFLQSREVSDQKQQVLNFQQQYTTICAFDFKQNSGGGKEWFWDEDVMADPYDHTPVERLRARARGNWEGGQLRLFSTAGGHKLPEKHSGRLHPTSLLFSFQNLSNNRNQFSFNESWPVTYPGMKSLLFVNCNNESIVTINGRAQFYNMDDDGTTKNYLSPGLTELPFLYIIFSIIYLTFIGVWILVCLRNTRSFNRTHLLMGGLLVINIFHFMCVVADLRYAKVTGNSDGWDVVYRISKVTRVVFLFTVITLIGAGWFFWKPVLKVKDKLVLIIVILLQVWVNVDPLMPWEAVLPYNGDDASYVDFICFGVIFIPMWWSHGSLEEISETHLNARTNLGKLSLFAGSVIVYVSVAKVYAVDMVTRYANYVVEETSLLVFCVVMFCIFRPVDRKRLNEFYSPV